MDILKEKTGTLCLNKNVIKWDLTRNEKSVVITFADAWQRPICCPSKKDIEDGIKIWGEEYLKKINLNSITIASIDEPSWYRDSNLAESIKLISSDLDTLGIHNRIGYGVSMGAFGVTAFSKILNIRDMLIFYPVSTLNNDLAPFIKGYNWARNKFDWKSGLNDGASTESKGLIIYDPFERQDFLHQNRYHKKIDRLRAFGIGHGGASKVINTGLVKLYLKNSYHEKTTPRKLIIDNIKKRRYKQEYYLSLKENNKNKKSLLRKYILQCCEMTYTNETSIMRALIEKDIEKAEKISFFLGGISKHADLFRDFAINNEKNIDLALKSMKVAERLRPNGAFIKNKISEYEKLTLKSN